MANPDPNTEPVTPSHDDTVLKKIYVNLFHELQFRASKNALMNYYQAEVLDEKGYYMKTAGGVMCAASSCGILAGIVQKGKMIASRFGVAGLVGIPISAAVELYTNSASDFLPSHQERAKKHVKAAAAWNRISDRSKTARLRLLQDKQFTQDKYVALHEELLQDKESVQRSVVLPRDLHRKFNEDDANVFDAIKRRKETFKRFQKHHLDEDKTECAESEEHAYYL